jgi:hypothetical protein
VSPKQSRIGAIERRAAVVQLQSEHNENDSASSDDAPPSVAPSSEILARPVEKRRKDAQLVAALQSIKGGDVVFDETMEPHDLRVFVYEQLGEDVGFACATLYEAGMLTKDDLLESARELLKSAATESVPAAANLDPATGDSNGELRAGVAMVYWEDRGRMHDAAVAANALYALKLAVEEAGLRDPHGIIEATQGYVYDHLRSGAYLEGTRYHPSPDPFLYYVSRLCQRFSECAAHFGGELRRALERRRTEPQARSVSVGFPSNTR